MVDSKELEPKELPPTKLEDKLLHNIAILMRQAAARGTFEAIFWQEPDVSPNRELSLYIYLFLLELEQTGKFPWPNTPTARLEKVLKTMEMPSEDRDKTLTFCKDFMADFKVADSRLFNLIKKGTDVHEISLTCAHELYSRHFDNPTHIDPDEEVEITQRLRLFLYYTAMENKPIVEPDDSIHHIYKHLKIKLWGLTDQYFYSNTSPYSIVVMQNAYHRVCERAKIELLVEKYNQFLPSLLDFQKNYLPESREHEIIAILIHDIKSLSSSFVLSEGIVRTAQTHNYEHVKNAFYNVCQNACNRFLEPINAEQPHQPSKQQTPQNFDFLHAFFELLAGTLAFISDISTKFVSLRFRNPAPARRQDEDITVRGRSVSAPQPSRMVTDEESKRTQFVKAMQKLKPVEPPSDLKSLLADPVLPNTAAPAV